MKLTVCEYQKNVGEYQKVLFSSSEHEELKVSYWDQSMSVPLSIVCQ